MFFYLQENVDEQLASDYYQLMCKYEWTCNIVCKKWKLTSSSDPDLIQCYVGKLNEFIKGFYYFVKKYKKPGKRGKITYGFKIHELRHVIPWIQAKKISPAYSDEQRMERKHISTNSAFDICRSMKGKDQIRYVLRYIAAMSKYRIQRVNNIINYEIGCDTGNIGYYMDFG